MSASYDPDGTVAQYITLCQNGVSGAFETGKLTSCTYDTPGTYWIWIEVLDNNGLVDVLSAYAVVTPSGSPQPPPPSQTGTINIASTTMSGAGTFGFSTSGNGLSGFSLTTSVAGATVSRSFGNLATGATGGSRTITATQVSGWQLTGLSCSAAGGSTVTTSGSTVTIANLAAGDTVTCGYTNTLQVSTTPPGVSITNPTGGTVPRSSTLSILGSVTPGTSSVARVDFLINGTVKCSDIAAPYSCTWNVPGSVNKKYSLQAIAYDSAGKSGASSTVTVTSSR